MDKTLKEYYASLPRQTSPKSDFIRQIMTACDVSFTTAMNWVTGKNRPLSDENLIILSELTGIPKERLFV